MNPISIAETIQKVLKSLTTLFGLIRGKTEHPTFEIIQRASRNFQESIIPKIMSEFNSDEVNRILPEIKRKFLQQMNLPLFWSVEHGGWVSRNIRNDMLSYSFGQVIFNLSAHVMANIDVERPQTYAEFLKVYYTIVITNTFETEYNRARAMKIDWDYTEGGENGENKEPEVAGQLGIIPIVILVGAGAGLLMLSKK